MSIELPEAKILAEQMNKELVGKRVESYSLKDYDRLQRIGFINKDLKAFDQLVNQEIISVVSRGNAVHVKLSKGANLILSPEYGGIILYHKNAATIPEKFHLRIDFKDDTALTVRLISMGGIHALEDSDLTKSYVFKRDFNPEILSPTDEEFTFDLFSKLLADNNTALKSVLVGKDAVTVGLSNSAFQDILYRARLHPKRRASELSANERRSLYDAIQRVLKERIKLGGKDQFIDLYGKRGGYKPAMGPNMKQQRCPLCGTSIQKMSVGGGQVFFCPQCQV
jgi:formamidopyrimidine-DNA glycosylase